MLQIIQVTTTGNTTLANVYTMANTVAGSNTTGNARGISVAEGIIFINGVFVKVETPTIGLVNAYGTDAGNSVVGFVLQEEIITENNDNTLLDNALGYSNENAPGAHRLKLTPALAAYTNATAAANASNTFNPIAQYNYSSIVHKNTDDKIYSTVGNAIAKRTYEEAGNYVINPFTVDAVTNVSGIVSSLKANNVLGRISPGAGYAQGQRVELEKMMYIDMRRGVDTEVRNTQQITFNYGNYYKLNDVTGSFDFSTAQRVSLYKEPLNAVTDRTFSAVSLSGKTLIGNAAVRMFTYDGGVPGTNSATYLLHVFDVKMATGYKPDDVQSVYYINGANVAAGDLAVTGVQQGASKSQLFTYNSELGVKNYLDNNNNNNSNYVYRKKITGKTMSTAGVISVTDGVASSAAGGTDILAYGTGRLPSSDAATFTVVCGANTSSANLAGSVVVNTTSTTVTANGSSGASFTSLNVGDRITVSGESQTRTIMSITNSTSMTVDAVFTSTNNAANYQFSYVKGQIIPVNIGSAYVNVVSSSEFTIYTTHSLSSSMPVDVVFNVKRTAVYPAKKEIRKSRYVRIDASSNPSGPWCLGFSDVHKINKIYASSSTYDTSGIDVTNRFVLDSGQKDTHYDYGYLYNINHDIISYPKLLVELDYFRANTATGVGFFTVSSYPIDDANTANTTAIQTKDIPLYVDEAGNQLPLRSYVDFRVPTTPSANDTGTCDSSNATQVTTAISYSSLNPSSTLTYLTNGGLNSPTYAENFSSDVTYYLPRKDLVFITAENVVKVKEGVSSLTPKSPLPPDNAMPIAVINMPAYPSLSSDQLDTLLQYNRGSKTLSRDTRNSISSNILTNRGYTMKDIARLDQRISNLEYYTQLTLLEKKASDMQVTDANGLNRFKNGIFVDNFSDYLNQLPSDPDYRIAIDRQKGVGRPYVSQKSFRVLINQNTSTNVQVTGRLVTLPYTEVNQLTQSAATKYRSAALVAEQWGGTVLLWPPNDNVYNLEDTGSLPITIDNTVPWKEFAASPYGSNYGAWRTSSSTETTSVKTGSGGGTIVKNIGVDLGFGRGEALDRQQLYNILVQNGENPPLDFIIGNVSFFYNSGYTPTTGTAGVDNWYHVDPGAEGPWGPGSYTG